MEIESSIVEGSFVSVTHQNWKQSQAQGQNQIDGLDMMDEDKRNKRAIASSSEEEAIPESNRWSMLSNFTNFLTDSFDNKNGSRAAKQQRREKE